MVGHECHPPRAVVCGLRSSTVVLCSPFYKIWGLGTRGLKPPHASPRYGRVYGLEFVLEIDSDGARLIGRHAGNRVGLPGKDGVVDGLLRHFVGQVGAEYRRRPRPAGDSRKKLHRLFPSSANVIIAVSSASASSSAMHRKPLKLARAADWSSCPPPRHCWNCGVTRNIAGRCWRRIWRLPTAVF